MGFRNVYQDKIVCVTGHTGFKGSWLSEWLLLLGAKVVGYSLAPPSAPSLFSVLQLDQRIAVNIQAKTDGAYGDVRSLDGMQRMLREHQPDFIFHLAAQPIVRRAFSQPYDTVETNIMGSLNVLESVRRESKKNCIVIMITTDKVYENVEWRHAYRENDTLGGHDPYSASKACAEVLISSYQRSFFSRFQPHADAPVIAVASVRGGNVIGGGDWAEDRIVPDCMRHLAAGQAIPIRNKMATRPWQHVIELLSGYLLLGAEIDWALSNPQPQNLCRLSDLCAPFNFGPWVTSNQSVEALVQAVLTHWPGDWQDLSVPTTQHEAGRLHLAIDKAYHLLGWQPQWNFDKTVQYTVDWYREYYHRSWERPGRVRELTQQQIKTYEALLLPRPPGSRPNHE